MYSKYVGGAGWASASASASAVAVVIYPSVVLCQLCLIIRFLQEGLLSGIKKEEPVLSVDDALTQVNT